MAIQFFYIGCVIYTLISLVFFLFIGILGIVARKENKKRHEEIVKLMSKGKEDRKN